MNCPNCGNYIKQTTYAWTLLWIWTIFGVAVSALIIYSSNKDRCNQHFSVCNLRANAERAEKDIPTKVNIKAKTRSLEK